jgi:hypothetical protein
MDGSGCVSSVTWGGGGALASAVEKFHLQSETKVYEATLEREYLILFAVNPLMVGMVL